MWWGLLFWVLIFYPAWSPRCRRARKRMQHPVSRNTPAQGIQVSRTDTVLADKIEADLETWGVGPNWVQDKPYPELFEEN